MQSFRYAVNRPSFTTVSAKKSWKKSFSSILLHATFCKVESLYILENMPCILPHKSGLTFFFASSVSVFGREQLPLSSELRVSISLSSAQARPEEPEHTAESAWACSKRLF